MGKVAIAQALFVRRKTVETHPGHVYSKLGITSLCDVGQLLAASSATAGHAPKAAP
jgi:DNA-binding NarL/FixJ family response regulator